MYTYMCIYITIALAFCLLAGIKALDKSVAEATEQRKEENEEYTELMASNTAAVDLIGVSAPELTKALHASSSCLFHVFDGSIHEYIYIYMLYIYVYMNVSVYICTFI